MQTALLAGSFQCTTMKEHNQNVKLSPLENDAAYVWPPYGWQSRTAEEVFAASALTKLLRERLPWGVKPIDEAFGGGILSGLLFEISGEAGAGKTQAALTLTAQTFIPQVEDVSLIGDFGVYYIFTEGTFPVERLREILLTRLKKYTKCNDLSSEETTDNEKQFQTQIEDILNSIFLENVSSEEMLWEVLCNKLPRLLQLLEIRLIVIDSLAALFRVLKDGLEKSNFALRAARLFRLSALLKRIATERRCWIVVINQVADIIDSTDHEMPHESRFRPALGLSWSNCVDCRVMLEKRSLIPSYDTIATSNLSGGVSRSLRITFAAHVPPSGPILYKIGKSGIEEFEAAKYFSLTH